MPLPCSGDRVGRLHPKGGSRVTKSRFAFGARCEGSDECTKNNRRSEIVAKLNNKSACTSSGTLCYAALRLRLRHGTTIFAKTFAGPVDAEAHESTTIRNASVRSACDEFVTAGCLGVRAGLLVDLW